MSDTSKTIKLLESFLSELEVDGICGFFVDSEEHDEDKRIAVYVIIDEDFVNDANTKPGYIARMIRGGVQKEIKKWLGIEVYVGSTVRKCNKDAQMNESRKKYIVTESQYKLILETQKNIDAFQEIIDNQVEYIRRVCNQSAEDYQGDVGHETCNQMESIEKVEVTDAEWSTIMHSNKPLEEKYMSIRLMIYYRSNMKYGNFDADDFTYDLEQILRHSIGFKNIIINYDSTNTNTFFEW